MTEIRRTAPTASAPNPSRWRRPALVAAAAVAVVATLTVAVPSGEPAPAASKEAVALLEDIALAAERAEAPTGVRDDQFVYIKSKGGWTVHMGDDVPATLQPVHQREIWLSVDGSQEGMLHAPYDRADHEPLEKQTPGIPSNTNYRHLQTLPTEPDQMYEWLNRVSEGSDSKDEANFVLVGDLARESLMPPEQAAALYRAAAKIRGVFVVDDAVDAAGRHGIAVARVDDGERVELIFDKKTKEFLGEREVAVEDLPWGFEKGEVTGRFAVLERAVVDKRGQRP